MEGNQFALFGWPVPLGVSFFSHIFAFRLSFFLLSHLHNARIHPGFIMILMGICH